MIHVNRYIYFSAVRQNLLLKTVLRTQVKLQTWENTEESQLAFIFFFFNFYQSTASLQCCASFYSAEKWISYKHTYIPSFLYFLPILVTTKLWSAQNCDQNLCLVTTHSAEFPRLYSRFSLVICFVYSSVYKSVPTSQPISLPFPLGIHTFVLTIQYYLP